MCWVKSIKQCIVFVVLIHLGLVFGRDIAFFCSLVVYLEIDQRVRVCEWCGGGQPCAADRSEAPKTLQEGQSSLGAHVDACPLARPQTLGLALPTHRRPSSRRPHLQALCWSRLQASYLLGPSLELLSSPPG